MTSTGQTLAATFAGNLWVIKRQVDGLTHDDSLVQPSYGGNCLNWVLGHIIVGRNRALALLQREPVWGEAESVVYETGSEPLTSSAAALPLETLLEKLDRSQELLAAILQDAPMEALTARIEFRGQERSVAEAIAGLAWHETYHSGQTEILRQVAGKADRVI